MCLIKLVENKIWMHDVLLKLGRDIVTQENDDPRKRSRLWDAKDVRRVLITKGTTKVESISLDLSETTEINATPAAFEGMKNLRLLKFHYPNFLSKNSVKIHLPQGLRFLSNELRILEWCYYPLKSFPSNFFPKKLVVLEMPDSKLEQLWNGYQPLENLKIMNLRSSSKLILSDFNFSNLPNLEVPNLDQLVELNLFHYTSLTCLPDSIGELKSLVELDLRYCKKLASLPSSIGKLTCLVKLLLGDCCELASLPESIGELKSLVKLDLGNCRKLASLPSSIGGLKSLVMLIVYDCSELASLPESIGELKCLETLYLSYCSKLASLPNSIYGLESLKWLEVGNCGKLNGFPILNRRRSEVEEIASTTNKLGCLRSLNMANCHVLEIPGSIGSWVSLTTLSLSYNDFERIPASIKQLPVLTELNLQECKRLQHLPQLPSSLRVLDATDCISLTSVEGIFMQGCDDYEAVSEQVFDFSSCLQLDQNSLTKIIGDARLRIERMATSLFNQQYFGEPVTVWLCIPGSEVPEWFTYKNTEGPTVKIKLPDHCHRANTTDQLFGFILCAVVSFSPSHGDNIDVECECHLITKDGTQSDLTSCYGRLDTCEKEREHVFIWSIHSHRSFKEASFHFKRCSNSGGSTADVVVQSGVHPLFVEDYIDEPEQPQPKRLKLMGQYILL
ncbi:hypothetical protein OIU76_028846 [Salix suchowensis]|nr:hypothetical protein OIU76_028846 [Salix suchowensis]